MESPKKSTLFIKILQVFEDFLTIIKGEIELAKSNIAYSVKKLSLGIALFFSAFFLANLTLLFFLISLAFGFVDLGLNTWLSFLLVGILILILSLTFVLFGLQAFRKIKGIGDAGRVASETKEYLKENIKKLSNN